MTDSSTVSRLYRCADPADRAAGLTAAVDAVGRSELVVLPTDTFYGIGADAFDGVAVTRLLAAKRRGSDLPLPVLVGSRQTLDGLVLHLPPAARDLTEAFWPGALTLVVRHAPSLSWDVGDEDQMVAVRMPLHPVALQLLASTGPMAVSGANVAGQPVAADAASAQEQFGDAVEAYLDAGPIERPSASTIVDVTGDRPRVLRLGGIDADALRAVVGDVATVDGGAA